MLKYDHLVGLPFVYGKTDCFSLLRQFYVDNFGLKVPNYARPDRFWEFNLNLYADKVWENGFRPIDVHPSEYRPGDLFLIAVSSTVANHAAVMVDNGKILHHVINNFSRVDFYGGLWRHGTLGVYRHPKVTELYEPYKSTIDLMDLLPPNKREELINAAAR